MSSHVGFREERIRTDFNYELPTLVQHLYTNIANKRSLCILSLNSERSLSGAETKIRERKYLSELAALKFLFLCEKWLVIFVISKFFLPTNIFNRSAIADDRLLFAMLPLLSLPVPALSWHHWGS